MINLSYVALILRQGGRILGHPHVSGAPREW